MDTPQVLFTPPPGIASAITALLATARINVRCFVYELTSSAIAAALVLAQFRDVDVQVIACHTLCDKPTAQLKQLAAAGIPIFRDAAHKIAHQKVTIVDAAVVAVGSYNYSYAAEHENAEDCVILADAVTAARFLENWTAHQAHSPRWSP